MTLVTRRCVSNRMPRAAAVSERLAAVDPRRSLGAKVGWFVAALSLALAAFAALWIGELTREGLRVQHGRQLALDTEQVAGALDQSLAARLQSMRAAAAVMGAAFDASTPRALRRVLEDLRAASPEMAWVGFAARRGRIVAATAGLGEGSSVAGKAWFRSGLGGPWIGIDSDAPRGLDFALPVMDRRGAVIGVIAARMDWRWLEDYVRGLRLTLRQQDALEAQVLERDGTVLVGPAARVGRRWPAFEAPSQARFDSAVVPANERVGGLSVRSQRLVDGARFLVARVEPKAGTPLATLGWTFQLVEPESRADRRADGLWLRIAWISLAIGAGAALIGVLISQRLTRRLRRLSDSIDAVGAGVDRRIEVPRGTDEVSRLAVAFSDLLETLQAERSELSRMGVELERRVAARTREVECLAEETRYAAVVRERLRMARDLHDTLAHSMMATLAQIRVLRKISAVDPRSLPDELARAEHVAHSGLIEARASIARMRFNGVRDLGLGPALAAAARRFAERTGIAVQTRIDPAAERFAEERGEAIFRVAEEALRNVERHAHASAVRVDVRRSDCGAIELEIADNGVGFDAESEPAGHFGLVGMREQAQLVGASLDISSRPERGTIVRLALQEGELAS